VFVFNDSAVFLERFGRFTRVAGPGRVFLRRFERIREVLDLRPQERSSVAKALTKDGIPVQTQIQVRFQLARPPASLVAPHPDVPHPVYEWALSRAGRCHLRSVNVDSGEEQVAHWPERASGVGGKMRALVAEYRLDELLEPYEPGRDPRREISQRLYQKLKEGARSFGAQILEVRMGALEPTLEEVKSERIASWQATWASEARRVKARGEAQAIRERGLARAYAQMEVILTLTREFQELIEHDMALSAEFIALRFIEALRHAWTQVGGMRMSADAVRTLDYLQRVVRRDYALPRGGTDE
jgi:regulator of protease activity HflC (stomatin/prohibitin superfamily)